MPVAPAATVAAAAVALSAVSSAGGGDSFLLFGGDYSFASVAAECFRFSLFFVTGVLGGAAGGAGGSLFIPLLLSVFNFYIYALPLSRAAVFGMAVGAPANNRHRSKPLIPTIF
jgi:hypothetical protein